MERPDCERKGSYLEKRDAAYLPSPSKEQSKFQVNALALQRDKTYVSSVGDERNRPCWSARKRRLTYV